MGRERACQKSPPDDHLDDLRPAVFEEARNKNNTYSNTLVYRIRKGLKTTFKEGCVIHQFQSPVPELESAEASLLILSWPPGWLSPLKRGRRSTR